MTEQEKEIIYLLAHKLTGAHPGGTYQHEIFVTNVERRMRECGFNGLEDYLKFAKDNTEENAHLISMLSIHTTSWFRENPHYVILQRILLNRSDKNRPYRMWSSACSTGEEVYSFAVLFEEFREFHEHFEYSVLGTDIDPISLKVAEKAIYEKKDLASPLSYYKKHVLLGSGHTEKLFTFTKSIRQRCDFRTHDIRQPLRNLEPFDLIVCRNVLIYFESSEVGKIVRDLSAQLRPGGHLILGHSEIIPHANLGLTLTGHSVYQKIENSKQRLQWTAAGNISTEPPKASSLTIADEKLPEKTIEPIEKVASLPGKMIKRWPSGFEPQFILIGASTGGPQAIEAVLSKLEVDCPPVIIVQHISPQFAPSFARNLSDVTGLKLGLTVDQTRLERGHLYVADGNYHLAVERHANMLLLCRTDQPPMNGHRPSVDFLFMSALDLASQCIAILLSGMGFDGASGMDLLHNEGAYTIAQSESDCAVYGMPKEAIQKNCVDFIGSAEQIGQLLCDHLKHGSVRAG